MPLGSGSKFNHVHGFTEVHSHHPANLVSEENCILCYFRAKLPLHFCVKFIRFFETFHDLLLHSNDPELFGNVVAQRRFKELAFLAEHPVALQITIRPEIRGDVKCQRVAVFERPARTVPAGSTLSGISIQNFRLSVIR